MLIVHIEFFPMLTNLLCTNEHSGYLQFFSHLYPKYGEVLV